MKSLDKIIEELDNIERLGIVEGQHCALLYEDIKAIQQKIKHERLSVSKGYVFKLKQAEQRLFEFLNATTEKYQDKQRRSLRASRFVSISLGLLFLTLSLLFLFIKMGTYIERFGMKTSSLFLLLGIATFAFYSCYNLILNRDNISSLRILALLWLPLTTWFAYLYFLSENWLGLATLTIIVLALLLLSLYPFAKDILKRLASGLAAIACCLIFTKTWEITDNIELFYFSMSLFLLPIFILMLTISFDYIFFLIPSAGFAVSLCFLFNDEIFIGKGHTVIKLSSIESPTTYWLTFLLLFVGWISISYKSYLMFISARDKSIHSGELGNVIEKPQI